MNKVKLEYSNIEVGLPSIDYFLDKIKNTIPFHFMRINHGILDLIHNAYENLSHFERDYRYGNYELIANKVIEHRNSDEHNYKHYNWHREHLDEFKSGLITFLKVIRDYKEISPKLQISVSLGVGLDTVWGVWEKGHPYQIGRDKLWNIIDANKNSEFYYSGVIKHYSVKNEIHKLFDTLNDNEFDVIFVGRQYFHQYEKIYNIKKFHHIEIKEFGAIGHLDETIESIKKIIKTPSKTILIYCTGHVISAILANEFSNTDLFGLDVGLSLDWKLRDNTNEKSNGIWMERHRINEVELNNYIDNIRR